MTKLNLASLAVALTFSAGCTTTATTPMPTNELTAIGAHSSKGGSYQVAIESAEKFCKRWRAAPNVISKEIRYQGTLQEDTNTAVNVATDVARAAGAWIPGIGSKDAYETTLTYKCY